MQTDSTGPVLRVVVEESTFSSNFQPIRLLDLDCCYKFAYLIANSADPDQLAFSE